jgi:aspartate kinase
MIVHKFGGTSVEGPDRFASVAEIILSQRGPRGKATAQRRSPSDTGHAKKVPAVVVVSAMSGVTHQLIAGARAAAEGHDSVYERISADLLSRHVGVAEVLLSDSAQRSQVVGYVKDQLQDLKRLYRSIAVLGELTARGRDAVASFGEHLSVHVLAAVLRQRGAAAQAVSSSELIVTDDVFGAATPLMTRTRCRLQATIAPLVERGVLPVITGFIGATEEGVTTTLGRGGSDYSAAVIGAGLDAKEVWIWSDVDGILTADPNIVPQALTLTELSYAEAADLAYVGAEVLHPKTIRPLVQRGIPLRIVNSYNPSHSGTLIVDSPRASRQVLPAIISTTGLGMIAIGSQDDTWALHMAARALQRLSESGIEVLMFSQSLSEHNLNLVIRAKDQDHCLSILRREFGDGHRGAPFRLGLKQRVATISVVGLPGRKERRNNVVSRTFAALGQHHTRVIAVAQAATEHSVSFCVPEDQLDDAVRFLHGQLGLDGVPWDEDPGRRA